MLNIMRIAIGSDHAGFDYKQHIKVLLEKLGHEVIRRSDAKGITRYSIGKPGATS